MSSDRGRADTTDQQKGSGGSGDGAGLPARARPPFQSHSTPGRVLRGGRGREVHSLAAATALTAGVLTHQRQHHQTQQIREGRGETVTDKVRENVCSFSTLRDRLTKCAGDGDLASLTVALEGTSRRGHFICRYCMGDRKHEAAGEQRRNPVAGLLGSQRRDSL